VVHVHPFLQQPQPKGIRCSLLVGVLGDAAALVVVVVLVVWDDEFPDIGQDLARSAPLVAQMVEHRLDQLLPPLQQMRRGPDGRPQLPQDGEEACIVDGLFVVHRLREGCE
jgi:hypothetical protein